MSVPRFLLLPRCPQLLGRWGLSSQESWAAICVASVCDTSGSYGRMLAAQKGCAAGEKEHEHQGIAEKQWIPNFAEKEGPESKEDKQEYRKKRWTLRLYVPHSMPHFTWNQWRYFFIPSTCSFLFLTTVTFFKIHKRVSIIQAREAGSGLILSVSLPAATHLLQVRRGQAEFLCWTSRAGCGTLARDAFSCLKCQHYHQFLWC